MEELFARRLSALLRQRGLTQKELAQRTGLTPAAISRYLSGARKPRAIIVAKIAEVLDVDPSDLLGSRVEQEIDGAVQLIARNANSLSEEQRGELIATLIRR